VPCHLQIRVVAPNPSSHCSSAHFRRAVLKSALCAAEQCTHEHDELVLTEPASGRPPANDVNNKGHAAALCHDLESSRAGLSDLLAGPLFTFKDTTPMFAVGLSTGVFEIHLDDIGKLGVDLGFWIAVMLVYCKFLGDREVSLGQWFMHCLQCWSIFLRISGGGR